jgi:alpha-L-fucosidase
MKKNLLCLIATSLSLCAPSAAFAQTKGMDIVEQTLSNPENEPAPVFPVPSDRQLKWQQTEFYAFFHYGMNTYTDKEWGYGNENVDLFAPTAKPDPEQWLKAVQAAGMKGGIAVVKHHDGFCLWPTKTTDHNISKSSSTNAQGVNIPELFAQAAQKLGMKYGFYVSPWDRNNEHYGDTTYVMDVFLKQCAELAQYGTDQFEMWFDGANGGDGYYGGKNKTISIDRETYYDVPNLRDSIHKVCPNIILWGVGGEARWIGNEQGWAGETNWCTENRGYAPEKNGMYGSENGWFWLPGESDAKFTDKGWFWHQGCKPLGAERTFQMYLETVGRNATLILNCPPDKSGKLPDDQVQALQAFGTMLKKRLGTNLATTATVTATNTRRNGQTRTYEPVNLKDGNAETYWAANDSSKQTTITFTWQTPQTIRYVALQEYVKLGQRVRAFDIEYSTNGTVWQPLAANVQKTTIGYKRIVPLNGSTTSSYGDGFTAKSVRILIKDSKACPCISEIGIY